MCLHILIGYLCKDLCLLVSPIRKREHEIKEILLLLDTGYLLVCHTLKCLFCQRPVVQEDIHFAVMGQVEAALNRESGLNYGIVLEDESGPSFPLIFVRVVKEALISLIQSHSAIRHNKKPVSRAVSEFTIFTQTIMHLVCPPKIMHHNSGAPNENIVQNHLNIELLNVF